MAQTADHCWSSQGWDHRRRQHRRQLHRTGTPPRASESGPSSRLDLAATLTRRGGLVERCRDGAMIVTGLDSAAIGGAASAHDITLLELAVHGASLEEAFFELTRDETDYHAGQLTGIGQGA